jgi:hypothetical protein
MIWIRVVTLVKLAGDTGGDADEEEDVDGDAGGLRSMSWCGKNLYS